VKATQITQAGTSPDLHYYLSLLQAHAGSSWWSLGIIVLMLLGAIPTLAPLLRETISTIRQIALCRILSRRTDLTASQYTTIIKQILKK
jgi:hypothetical protein